MNHVLIAAQAGLLLVFKGQQREIGALRTSVTRLKAKVVELKARLDQNPSNSTLSRPSELLHVNRRLTEPPGNVGETTECMPTACRRCGQELSGNDDEPCCKPQVMVYRHCGVQMLGPLPIGAPRFVRASGVGNALGVVGW